MEAELPAELIAKWLRAPITGCLYASAIATKPDISPIRFLTVRNAPDDPALPPFVHAMLSQAAEEPVAVLFIFPTLRVDEDIVRLVANLTSHKEFSLFKVAWPEGRERADVIFLLEWMTPKGLPSRTMGLAPSGLMPLTRRAPFVCLMVWPGGHDNHHRAEKPRSVGVVDMKHTWDKDRYDGLWDESKKAKGERDKEEPSMSASFRNVTFCISARAAGELRFTSDAVRKPLY